MDMVPTLKHNSLVRTSTLASENYHTATLTEVLVYDGKPILDKVPVWKGWRDSATGLWRVPLITEIVNLNMDTVIMTKEKMNDIFREQKLNINNILSKAEAM